MITWCWKILMKLIFTKKLNRAMKRLLFAFMLFVLLMPANVIAQNPAMEKLNAYKIAFFTRRLNLTPQEAEKFWPVYNEYQNKRMQIQTERARVNRDVNQNELNMSEKEMIEIADKLISMEVDEAMLAQEYHKRFKEVLTPQKVIRLYQAENQYRLQLLNELRENNPERRRLQDYPGRDF